MTRVPIPAGPTQDPSVLAWMIALAPRPRPPKIGRHWWRDMVTEAWRAAFDAWQAEAERVAVGYDTELAEYAAEHPRPRLGEFMRHLSGGRADPHELVSR